jgi:hypothetical protein
MEEGRLSRTRGPHDRDVLSPLYAQETSASALTLTSPRSYSFPIPSNRIIVSLPAHSARPAPDRYTPGTRS